MNQQTIDKLMEIKKLYEAGILTKEEMKAEKAKILPSTTLQSAKEENHLGVNLPEVKVGASDDIKNETKDVASSHTPKATQEVSKATSGQGQTKKVYVWPFMIAFVVVIILIISIAIQAGNGSNYQAYDNDYAVADTDTATVDDSDEEIAVDDNQEHETQTYAEKAKDYIGGLDTDTRVVASLTDDKRHCVYTLTEVEAGWGRINNLYCHNIETGSTNLISVPYKVEGEEDYGEQVADAKMIGNNLYVINTSYRCGNSVACLNTLTNNWSCTVRACADAKFVGTNKLKVTYSKLVYEGECLADNQYEYTDKVITLK